MGTSFSKVIQRELCVNETRRYPTNSLEFKFVIWSFSTDLFASFFWKKKEFSQKMLLAFGFLFKNYGNRNSFIELWDYQKILWANNSVLSFGGC